LIDKFNWSLSHYLPKLIVIRTNNYRESRSDLPIKTALVSITA
jgi:hypothetical protein